MATVAEKKLIETVQRVTRRGRRFVARKNGRVVGAIISRKDFERLQLAIEDESDARESVKRLARETPVPYETVRLKLKRA